MHLVGFDSLGRGRVSCAVGVFDRDAMRAFTSDGNPYQLVGKPESLWAVHEVWERRFRANCEGTVIDVTEWPLAESAAGNAKSTESPVRDGTHRRVGAFDKPSAVGFRRLRAK